MKLTDAEKARLLYIKTHFDAAPRCSGTLFEGMLHGYVKDLLPMIDRLSQEPDGPDVVFCEDCIRFKDGECNSAYGLPDPVDETDYCSYGERRKEQNNG